MGRVEKAIPSFPWALTFFSLDRGRNSVRRGCRGAARLGLKPNAQPMYEARGFAELSDGVLRDKARHNAFFEPFLRPAERKGAEYLLTFQGFSTSNFLKARAGLYEHESIGIGLRISAHDGDIKASTVGGVTGDRRAFFRIRAVSRVVLGRLDGDPICGARSGMCSSRVLVG